MGTLVEMWPILKADPRRRARLEPEAGGLRGPGQEVDTSLREAPWQPFRLRGHPAHPQGRQGPWRGWQASSWGQDQRREALCPDATSFWRGGARRGSGPRGRAREEAEGGERRDQDDPT